MSHEVTVLTPAIEFGSGEVYPQMSGRGASRRKFGQAEVWYLGRPMTVNLFSRLRREVNSESSLYVSSLFSFRFSLFPILLCVGRIIRPRELIIAPRGELGPAALGLKYWKKRPVNWALRRLLARRRWVVWHATSALEAQAIRNHYGVNSTIRQRSNEWPPPVEDAKSNTGDRTAILFAARIVPIKGLDVALDALHHVREQVTFVIAGSPEDQDYWAKCQGKIARLPPNVFVDILGHLDAQQLTTEYERADMFLLPTGGENFGHSIGEAFSHGIYVMIPDTTPWTPLLRAGAGEIIDKSPQVLARRIDDLARMQTARARRPEILQIYRASFNRASGAESLFSPSPSRA